MNPTESFLEQFSASLSSSSSSSSSSSRASSSSSSSAGPAGAGGSSRSSATSPSGETSNSEQSSFVPGATSASASANATASDQGATTSATVSAPVGEQEGSSEPTDESNSHDSDEEPDIGASVDEADEISQTTLTTTSLLLGTPAGGLLVSTPQPDMFWGGGGADIFQLSTIGVTELSQADTILNYSRTEGDVLALSEGITLADLVFEVIDFSGDGRADSTVLRSSVDHSILGIVLNTVDDLGNTLLSVDDFTEPVAAEILAPPAPGSETTGSSRASSSSSAFVDGDGAGGSSSATATSPTGETSTSSETAYLPGASSIGSSASASAADDDLDTQASVQGSASGVGILLEGSSTPVMDVLMGTPDNATLVGGDHPTIFVGHSGADLFVLSAMGRSSVQMADIVLGFSPDQGDRIQLPEILPVSHITLEAIDLRSNGRLNSVAIKSVEAGDFYAVILDTSVLDVADSLGLTTL